MTELDQLIARLPEAARLPLLLALTAFAAWGVLYLMVLAATRPLPLRPDPPTQDLPGDEPPALVNLLVNQWTVTEDGAESTFLDLAARGYLELRQPDADVRHTTVHVTALDPKAAAAAAARQARVLRSAGGGVPLTPYEERVLAHVQAVAVGGVVPLTALTFRDAGKAAGWASSFADEVISDARARGLLRRRVPQWAVALLGAAAAVPALATGWLVYAADGSKDVGALTVGLFPWVVLSAIAGQPRGYRGTPLGRQVAARWLGLRSYLQVDSSFAALPPSAVAVWDRYLAYGDALGVTHVCRAAIDFGMGNRRRVWSSLGGQWHQVRVRYPGRAPRYGAHPVAPLFFGMLQFAAGYGFVRLAGLRGVREATQSWVEAAVLAAAVLLGARGLYVVVRGVMDLAGKRLLTGEVLWIDTWKSTTQNETTATTLHYLAVDDGTSDVTTAWALPPALLPALRPGQLVRIAVRPWTRRVVELEVVPDPAPAGVAPTGVPSPVPATAAAAGAVLPGVLSGVPAMLLGAAALDASFTAARPDSLAPGRPDYLAPSRPGTLAPAGVADAPTAAVLPPSPTARLAGPTPRAPQPADSGGRHSPAPDPQHAAPAADPLRSARTEPIRRGTPPPPPPVPLPANVARPMAPAAVTSGAGAELLSASELAGWFGLPLEAAQPLPLGPSTQAWMFRRDCGPAAPGVPAPATDVVLVSAGRGTADAMALQQARRGTPVPGLGEEAYLVDQGAVARWGSVVVQVTAPPSLGVSRDALLTALQTAVVRVAKQRIG